MGGYGRPGQQTGGGYCAVAALCIVLTPLIGGCAMFGRTPVYGEIPECERLIPPSLTGPVNGVAIPDVELFPDGHEKAEPWQLAFLGQTGQLDKANERAPAVDHIYRTCLELNRKALERSRRGFFGRLFG